MLRTRNSAPPEAGRVKAGGSALSAGNGAVTAPERAVKGIVLYDHAAEGSVLAAMLTSRPAAEYVRAELGDDGSPFHDKPHAKIYRAALTVLERAPFVDSVTLCDELARRNELEGVGGRARVDELTAVNGSAHLPEHVQIVRDLAHRRGIVQVAETLRHLGRDRQVLLPDLLGRARAKLDELDARVGAEAKRADVDAEDVVITGVLDDVVALIRRYVVLTEGQARAIALWIAHTHAFAAADATPYLAVTSAEKRSGKTRTLDVVELLAAKPWRAITPSEAVVFRTIDRDVALQRRPLPRARRLEARRPRQALLAVWGILLLLILGIWLFVRTWWGHLPHLVAAKAFPKP